eukprot:g29333.t1
MTDCFRNGDFVRAQVLALGDHRSYVLTTAVAENLGVIAARSVAGAPLAPISWQFMKCPVTGKKDELCWDGGLFAQTHHAWASADELLHIWDYHKENPKVLVIPADSAIVSVHLCPPRPGIFDRQVQWLLVICTRISVSLVGLHYEPTSGLARRPDESRTHRDHRSGWQHPTAVEVPVAGVVEAAVLAPGYMGHGGGDSSATARNVVREADGLTLLQLEGYSARCDGALFHLIRHTPDGHILLASGAPQVYELAYSSSAGWFTCKCRLIRHAGGLQARLRDFLHFSWRCTGRIRLLECASQASDGDVLGRSSVAVLQELVALPSADLAQMAFEMAKRPLASRIITHLFPVVGLDGHLRLQVVTAASEHMLFVCSASSPTGPSISTSGKATVSEWSIVDEFNADWTQAGAVPRTPASSTSSAPSASARRTHGFWLQQVTDSRRSRRRDRALVLVARGYQEPSVTS